MQRISNAVPFVIGAIAIYFVLLWGIDAFRVFSSPVFGLEDKFHAQALFAIGGLFNLTPIGVMHLAAFFGSIKLAAAVLFALCFLDRFRAVAKGAVEHDFLDAALFFAVFATIVAATPALLDGAPHLIRQHTLNLVLAGVVGILSVVERMAERDARPAVAEIKNEIERDQQPPALVPINAIPSIRERNSPRWMRLRQQAGLVGSLLLFAVIVGTD